MKLDSKLFDGVRILVPCTRKSPRSRHRPAPGRAATAGRLQGAERQNSRGGRIPQFLPRARPPLQHGLQLLLRHEAGGHRDGGRRSRLDRGRPSWGSGAPPPSREPTPTARDVPQGPPRRPGPPLSAICSIFSPGISAPRPATRRRSASANCTNSTAGPSKPSASRGSAKWPEIKHAYKALVKIHHPDANGGDKSSEDRLRAIIAAYTHLKRKGSSEPRDPAPTCTEPEAGETGS